MKYLHQLSVLFFWMLLVSAEAALAVDDMRVLQIQAQEALQELVKKSDAEEESARREAQASRSRILNDREQLQAEIKKIEEEVATLTETVEKNEKKSRELTEREHFLQKRINEIDGIVRELVGVIRINAKDISVFIENTIFSGLARIDTGFLQAIADNSQFPGMEDVEKMISSLLTLIKNSQAVFVSRGNIIDVGGTEVDTDILMLGSFTAAYRNGKSIGLLNYLPENQQLYALARSPSAQIRKQFEAYMNGQVEAVPIDISRGGALNQLEYSLTLSDQIKKGGPLVWPILAILIVGIIIVIERVIFLMRNHTNADTLISRINQSIAKQDWKQCLEICNSFPKKAVARILKSGIEGKNLSREDMEAALQEAILREIPSMERFLSTLAVLAAIAPLLGLLGTVTGMIDTFHIITQYGTGDPRMMSGGISEALVTTMLGLSVAIPIMLAHTLINRSVDTRIGQMEEKAVALINNIQQQHHESC